MAGAIFMTLAGCVMLVHSPMSMVGTIKSLLAGHSSGMQRWAFVYVHIYLICLHLLTTAFLLYAVPLSVLALRSAFLEESRYLRSYFRMNVQVVGLLVLGSLFNLMLDNTLCDMAVSDPYGAVYPPTGDVADALEADRSAAGGAGRCGFGANVARLALSIALAVIYIYLAWITYCYRRELEQGTQLDDADHGGGVGVHGGARAPKPRGGGGEGVGSRGGYGDDGEDGGYGGRGGGGGYADTDGARGTEIPVRARIGDMVGR